ncbi:MAG: fused MFS/spermidine synthase, partial [Ignavibacteriales bacterium]|nr:fused MFS/spermidine synthase [Ignavibacteriales bacterium]
AGVSGAAAMIYEVGWVRLLIPILGSSTYSFSLMLVGFISGIAIGSYLVSQRIERHKNPFRLLAFCQFGVSLSLLMLLPIYGRVPYYFWHIASVLVRTETTYALFLGIEFLFAAGLMIVPTIFLGMSLPIAARITTRTYMTLGRSVGNVFSVNTVGTVVGSLAAGFLLIPLFGVKHTMEIGTMMNLAAGTALILFGSAFNGLRRFSTPMVAGGLVIALLLFAPEWHRGVMISGVFRHINRNDTPPSSYEAFKSFTERTNIVFYKEGASASVGVLEGETPRGKERVLVINGKPDASSQGDLPTQVLLAQLPALLHPHPQRALVVGFGSGVTLGSVLTHPLREVECVEISPEVIEASQAFADVNGEPLRDARTRLFLEDAQTHLQLAAQTYDLIISEPSNPWIAGVGNLYSREFFEHCRNRLNDGGMMAQWFHLYEMDDETFKLVVRTFQSSFKYVTLWQSLSTDVILLGSNTPLRYDNGRLTQRMRRPEVVRDLDRLGIRNAAALLSLQVLAEESLRQYAGAGELNLEDTPRLEYVAPKAFFINQGVRHLNQYDERMLSSARDLILHEYFRQQPMKDDDRLAIGSLHTAVNRGSPMFGYVLMVEYLARHPDSVQALIVAADAAERLQRGDEELQLRSRIAKLQEDDPHALEHYAWLKFTRELTASHGLSTQEFAESERLLRRCVTLVHDTVDRYRVRLADMFFARQLFVKASDQYARALEIRERYDSDPLIVHDRLLLQLARCLAHLGKRDRAVGYAFQASRFNPQNAEAKDFLYDLWMGSSAHH